MQCPCSLKTKLWKSLGCAVADYYYEISDAILHNRESKYYVAHVRGGHDAMMAGGATVTMNSERIWRQDNDSVRYVKHRYEDVNTAVVDLKEFMWVKLKAETLRD